MKIDNQKSLEEKWAQQAQDMRDAAEHMPHTPEQAALLRTARQLDTASEMHKWLSSKELRPPK